MKSDRQASVAIIGGGYSGTMLAAWLARHRVPCRLFDPNRMGRGVAYSTREPAHLLNVRAEAMSAWSDQPSDFADFFAAAGGEPKGFAPRRDYGAYLDAILGRATADGWVETVDEAVVGAGPSKGGWDVEIQGGETFWASALVLAQGNQPPATSAGESRRSITDPWGPAAQDAVAQAAASGAAVLLVGTGLTMIDLVLSLDAAGHDGPIVALSRRGLIPRAHAEFVPAPVGFEALPARLGELLRWLRRRAAEQGWRAAVDSLRPHSHVLWAGLSEAEQRRFLRHARPWWDVHRHRIAPEVAERLRDLIAAGRLTIIAGKIIAADLDDEGATVSYRRRGDRETRVQSFGHMIDCTGPLADIGQTRDPLLRALLDAGFARADTLRLGLEVDERSRAMGVERLWAIGPLTKGRYWEIVAVPDIRNQVAAVAADIAKELAS